MGFATFSVDHETFIISVKKIDYFTITLSASVHVFSNYIFLQSYYINPHHSKVADASFPVLLYLNYLIHNFAAIWMFRNRHEIALILRKLHNVDVELNKLGIVVSVQMYKKLIVKLFLLTASLTIFIHSAVLYQVVYETMKFQPAIFFLSFWCYFGNLTLTIHFLVMTLELKLRFRALNNGIK